MIFSHKNYYRILRVSPRASRKTIRTAFRNLAKKYHPDTSRLDTETATIKMRALLEAYRILIDSDKRAIYDLRFQKTGTNRGRTYRETLESRRDDPYSLAMLVFYDLLNGNRNQAIFNYEEFRRDYGKKFELGTLLGFADYLDCAFLLAEAYQGRGNFREAGRLYEDAYREDREWNYFRHFRQEVKQRIRTVYCRQLPRILPPEEAIGCYRKLLEEYSFPKNDRAFFLKKIAESYCHLDQLETARHYFQEALKLKPNLSGTKKLRQKLGAPI